VSIIVEDLRFSYKNFRLRVTGLKFESSRITAIVGPNGAGKTTFLKCLGAILPVAKGMLILDGRDLAAIDGRERARLISYVPQEQAPTFNYTVLDYVVMGRAAGLSLFSSPSDRDFRIAAEALDYVGLGHYAERSHLQLSSGERRLVLIARALAQQSDIMLLDEPTTFLDPRHEIEIMELTRRLAGERKKTILVTLHNLEMAIRYSDNMIFMKNGEVVASGKPSEILTEELIERVYDLKMRIVDFESRKLIVR
jgi:iron complex transport system ATP-binding protein